jgi:fructose-1,6-bisphosphatase II
VTSLPGSGLGSDMEALLALDMVRVTEAAALASARFMGRGDRMGADHAAVEAMRRTMDELDMAATIVIGEGERDQAPMLYIGERVGRRVKQAAKGQGTPAAEAEAARATEIDGARTTETEAARATETDGARTGELDDAFQIDIAVDPLEGTNLVAMGVNNAITVLAASERGGLVNAPDTYLEKLCVGPVAAGHVDIRLSPRENVERIAAALGRRPNDITVIVLDRPRHERLIADLRKAGARIKLISDGDLSAAISVAVSGTGVHAVMGIGGAPEGVITAAALRCLGGEIQARFRYRDDEERQRGARMGHGDESRVYGTEDLASGTNLIFAATGVTAGDLLQGVRFFGGGARTHSLVMGYQTKQVRFVDTVHMFDRSRPPAVRL